jgi:mannose-6-phosphate isomerase-like protein (cupin superfamily)
MGTTDASYTRAGWDDLHNANVPRPVDYVHVWPTNQPYVSRVYSGVLGCEHFAWTIPRIGPGQSGEHHRHVEAEEIHVLLDGHCQMMLDDEVVEAKPLDAIRVPAHVYRSFHNHSDRDALWFVMAAPVHEFFDASPDYTLSGQTKPAPLEAGDDPGSQVPTRVGWDDLSKGAGVRRPPGYVHPWPTDIGYESRDYTNALGCQHLSFVLNRVQPGQSGQHHLHADAEEVYFLVRGPGRMRIGDEIVDFAPLDAVRIPPGVLHSIANEGDEESLWVVVGAPIDEFEEPGLTRYHAANDRAFAAG